MKIGVFDSGVGGKSVADVIQVAFPNYEVLLVDDREHLPYGSKTPIQLLSFVVPKLQELISQGCGVIVIACNTVTTTIIEDLRSQFTIPLVGMEPMIKPAAEATKSKVVAVCATPSTIASNRYAWLKKEYAKGVKVLEPDCNDWAILIEENKINHKYIREMVEQVCNEGADVIVLGCTHYHWIEKEIVQAATGRAVVLQSTKPVLEQLRRVIS